MENNHQIEKRVMEKINSGRLKLRSKYIFLAEKLGLGSAFILSLLLAVLFFSLFLFYLKASDNLVYLTFGSRGLFAWLESFPYLMAITLTIFIIIASWIIKKSDLAFKKPFSYFIIGLLAFIMLAGTILAFTNISERIEQESLSSRPAGRFIRPFFEFGLPDRSRGLAGRIIEAGENYLIIQTPQASKKIDLSQLTTPLEQPLLPGMFVVILGQRQQNFFIAERIHLISENEMPIIRHGVRGRFGPFENSGGNRSNGGGVFLPLPNGILTSSTEQCFKDCFDDGLNPPACQVQCQQ